ncbi:choice-of-anchor P family protein [Nocardioides sp. SOB77]|uniref:Choice-of-anchor P family protein n=1 Tax=Nocardioides oceani TaxID=3058369 RepID=A0ABT8FIU2_9ACTN|nr:choice-of-anchor P family protein [Nocardioides oceani]MDN4174603.1 choice-of-anchor P family protein [Nocardioides oceani]
MKRTPLNPSKRGVLPLVAGGLVAAVLPLGATTASPAAAQPSGPSGKETLDYGYSSEGTATPIKLEIFEPVIPIPATPQFELNLGYSKVTADSSGGKGRAAYLWPGDSIGEGLKTVVENLGLPPEIANPIAEQGYPIQVNSAFPGGPESEAQEPFPGSVSRTSAGEGDVRAASGFSSDCDVEEPDAGDGGDGGDGGGDSPIPGLPEIPGLPTGGLDGLLGGLASGLGGLTGGSGGSAGNPLSDFGAAITGQSAATEAERQQQAEEEAAACQIPSALNALVDVGGMISTSRSQVEKGSVTTTTRSALGDVRLLGGIITLSGVTAKAVTSSDGKAEKSSGKARYGTLSIAGQEFSIGPDGYEAVGQGGAIPGLSDDPAKALEQLGVSITLPKPRLESGGKAASAEIEALRVQVDLGILKPVLSQIPLGEILAPIPFPEEAAILKSLLGALNQLSPRIVLHLGVAGSEVKRAPKLDLPEGEIPDNDPSGEGGGDSSGGGSGGTSGGTTGSGTAGTPSSPSDLGAGDAGGDSAPADGDLVDAAPAGAGLPPLNSIPGALLFGGIALAAVAGSYLRKIGALALGAGASCPHGLDSGLPDLRKA